MTILQAGMAKSGNFWLYKILQNIIVYGGLEQRSFIKKHPVYEQAKTWSLSFTGQADIDILDIRPEGCFYQIWPVFCEPIENIDCYISQCSHVWTHFLVNEYSLDVLPKFDKVVYIIRDPRDVAISQAKFAFTPYMQMYAPSPYEDADSQLAAVLEGIVKQWVRHVGSYLKHKDELGIHILFYERLLNTFDTEIADLLAYLDIDLDDGSITRIKKAVTFESMKLKNPHHVRKGRVGTWQQRLSTAQQKSALRIAGPMLNLLNYPTEKSRASLDKGTDLPQLPALIDCDGLEKVLAQTRWMTPWQYVKRSYAYFTGHRSFSEKLNRIKMIGRYRETKP